MPTFKFTSPDGKQYTVNGPEGATEQQAFQMLQSQMAPAAPAPAPSKPFGQQMNETIADIPRQLGLTARYGIEGVGAMGNMLTTPFRAALNAVTPDKTPTISDVVAGRKPGARFEPINFPGVADSLGLPQPKNAFERTVGSATRTLAGSMVPIGLAGSVAQNTSGVTQAVARGLAANPLQQMVSGGSAGAAGGYVKETGGNETSQMLASAAAGIVAPYAVNKLGQAVGAVSRLGQSQAPTPAQIDIHIDNALQPSGIKLGDLPASMQASIRKDVTEAFNTSGSVTPMAVRRLADYRLTGTTPTAAGLTDNPAVITQQRNLAKLGINSKDAAAQTLGQTENTNNKLLVGGLNELGAGTSDTAIAGGRKVMNALSTRNDAAKSAIDAGYAAARATNGRSAALDPHAFSNQANSALDEALLGGKLPADVKNLLNNAASGKMPLTVDTAEQFKTRIGDLQRASADASERKALGLVRQALEETPLLDGQGKGAIEAFNRARSMHKAWMGVVEKTPALQAVRDGVEPDKFVQQFIVGGGAKANVADLASLRESVKSSPEALQAVREQIAAHLKSRALSGATDEVGSLSQSAYNKALNAIGDEKLALFFTKPELDKLRAIGRVASYEQVQPKGSAVNNSNSAAAIGNILDRIAGSSLLSKIPFGKSLQEPVQNIAVGFKSNNALNVPKALAGNNALTRPPRAPAGLLMTPAALMQKRDDEK